MSKENVSNLTLDQSEVGNRSKNVAYEIYLTGCQITLDAKKKTQSPELHPEIVNAQTVLLL